MPGVVHSDVVIVQSENMRRLYIEKLTTAAGEDTRSIWENKVVCMKLPADRRNEETEYEDIPECFSNLAERRKANGKSVIYYISVGNIVEYAQTALKKIESVLETFEMHKDEVTLIWRHDALIREVLENGYHDLYEGYMNILDKCRQKPWIVSDFDNNIDEYINLSDAYYGDGSPLANKCRNYGKPVMLQSIDDVE
jgi:hypothetical protein